jgi:hypothetical protein
MTTFENLQTLDDVRQFVREGYRAAMGSPKGPPLRFGFERGRLPLSVAEPGPLIEHAVRIAGQDGLTLQVVRWVFEPLGAERVNRGLAFARESGALYEARERRPNRSGRPQQQVVLYAVEEAMKS